VTASAVNNKPQISADGFSIVQSIGSNVAFAAQFLIEQKCCPLTLTLRGRLDGGLFFIISISADHRTPHALWRLNSSGSFAIFTAIRLASSRSNNFAADLRPGSSSK
jgi:hypothetical protein